MSQAGRGPQPVLLNWPANNFYGWGIVGANLLLQWACDADIRPVMGAPIAEPDLAATDALRIAACSEAIMASNGLQRELQRRGPGARLNLPVVEGLGNGLQGPPGYTGTRTIARCIFEDTDLGALDARLAKYDVLLCASHWNAALLQANTKKPVRIILEGTDPSLFHPAPKSGALDPSRFYIFSGGKVEYRKGHDLTLLAFREFSRRHPDAVLVTAWHSPWPELSAGFKGRLEHALQRKAQGPIDAKGWVAANGIDPAKIIEIGQVPNPLMPAILREVDCALAPSRAEACTNLLAKEAMACGVPVILAENTGVKDLVADGNCVALKQQKPVTDRRPGATEGWGESDVEEILAALENLYTDTAHRRAIGQGGADWIIASNRTWASHAEQMKAFLLAL